MRQKTFKTSFQKKIESLGKAELVNALGVTRQAVEYWLDGGMPSPENVRKIVSKFDVTYADFFEYEKDELLD